MPEKESGSVRRPKAANVFNLSASGLRPTKFTAGVFKAPNPGKRALLLGCLGRL